jgi:integrase
MRTGLLDPSGPLSSLPDWHQKKVLAVWSRWLGFHTQRFGHIEASGTFTQLTLEDFVAVLQLNLAPATVWANVRNLRLAATALEPEANIRVLLSLERALRRNRRPQGRRQKLVPVQDLYRLGFSLMASAETLTDPAKAAALYRDGLAIALLAARPFRMGNFASIEIGRHLLHQGDDLVIQFDGSEVKNGRPISVNVPHELEAPLTRYIDVVRPTLLKKTGRWSKDPGPRLWISEHGSALHPKPFAERISRHTRRRFGVPIGPHLFRNNVATSIATEDPAHVGIIAAILGHTNSATAERYYNLASSLDASRRWQEVMSELSE